MQDRIPDLDKFKAFITKRPEIEELSQLFYENIIVDSIFFWL